MLFIVKKDRSVESILGNLNIGDTATDIVVVTPFTGIQTCEIKYTMPNGQEGKPAFATFYNGKEFENGSAYVMRIPKEMNAVAGEVRAQIVLTDTTAKQFVSNPFTFPVDGITALPFPEDEEQGSDFAAILKALAATYAAFVDNFEQTVAQASENAANEAIEKIKVYEESLAKIKAECEATIANGDNFFEELDIYYNTLEDWRTYTEEWMDAVLDEAKDYAEQAKNAAANEIQARFAGKYHEDASMNLYSGDSVKNTGENGDDVVTGKCNAILNSGGGNKVSGDHNLVSGALNTVDAENCITVGLGNHAKLVEKEVNGVKHTYGHRAALFGRHLISNANDQMWVGRWNVEKEGVLFGVGAGTADKRFNAFVVYPKGTASVGHDPIGDMDVVTKRYCDGKIGNVSEALDAIIAMQESFIGGDAV